MVETAGAVPETIVVEATVDGVSKFRDKMRINLTIPAFKSDYPTNCTDFPEGMDTAVKVGDTHKLELKRQSLVKRHGGGTGDGSKPFHYYWGINGRSEEPVTVFAVARSQDAHPSGDGLRNDPAGVSIESQTAYKGAIDLAVARINKFGIDIRMEAVLEDTELAALTIHGGPVVREVPEPAGAAPEDAPPPDDGPAPSGDETQEAFDALGRPGADGGEEIGNLADFMTKAQQGGHGYSAKILQKLGVSKPVEIQAKYGTFDAAMKKLTTP